MQTPCGRHLKPKVQSPKSKSMQKKAGKEKFKIKLKRKAQKHRRSRGQDENRRTDKEKEENTGIDTQERLASETQLYTQKRMGKRTNVGRHLSLSMSEALLSFC